VKLLLDENLAPRLSRALSDLFPGSTHVSEVGLERADDTVIWEYARGNGFAILSKDSDFHQRSFVFGAPPKVIWIRAGNCTTRDLELMVRRRVEDIREFEGDSSAAFLVISGE
jgi:predicted nuclease of predicted toxin-antitoxin system